MKYRFKWKRGLFWQSAHVIGHSLDKDQDKMVLYFPDGSIREICKWRECEVKLGQDWVLATKKTLESAAGTSIPLNV